MSCSVDNNRGSHRIHPPLDTNRLDLAWINYEANKSLCEMFPDDRIAVKSWEKDAKKSLEYVTKKAAPYLASLRAGGCKWETIPSILNVPTKAVEAIRNSDYMIFAIEDWIIRIGSQEFYKVADDYANPIECLVNLFGLKRESSRSILTHAMSRGDL